MLAMSAGSTGARTEAKFTLAIRWYCQGICGVVPSPAGRLSQSTATPR